MSEPFAIEFQHDAGTLGAFLNSAEEGATRIWTVVGDGAPEPGKTVQVAESVLMKGDEGHAFYQVTGEFREVTIVDSSRSSDTPDPASDA